MSKFLLDTDELFNPPEAAKMIGIGYATLYRWIKKELIFPVRIAGQTLIPKSEIDRVKTNLEQIKQNVKLKSE